MPERQTGLDFVLRLEDNGATDSELYDECREACVRLADTMDRMHRAHTRPQYVIAAAYLREALDDLADEATETLERR